MQELDWEKLGQGLAALGAVMVGILAWMRGHAKSSGAPPPERPPAKDEVKAALDALRDRIDLHADGLGDDLGDMRRDVDRIERMLERIADRLDADARIGSALAQIRSRD